MAAPTLTAHADMDPSPRVDILFSSSAFVSGTATITIHQVSTDGDVVVRNADRIFASGGAFVTDYEVPPGVPVQYVAEQFNAGGVSLGFTASATTQVNFDKSMVVVSDPLAPQNAVMVEAQASFAGRITSDRALQLYRIGNDTVALMGAMGLAQDIPLNVQTKTLADAVALNRVLAQTQILVRTMPAGVPLIPRCLHVVVPSPTFTPVDVHYGGSWVVYPLTANQVTRSSLTIIVPVVTYQQYIDQFPTYTAFNAAYATYLTAIANPPATV